MPENEKPAVKIVNPPPQKDGDLRKNQQRPAFPEKPPAVPPPPPPPGPAKQEGK
jgi:hypothetical protein